MQVVQFSGGSATIIGIKLYDRKEGSFAYSVTAKIA